MRNSESIKAINLEFSLFDFVINPVEFMNQLFSVTNSITSKTLKTTFISLLYHYRKCELHNQIYELEFEINVTLQSIHLLYYLYIIWQRTITYILCLTIEKQQK